MRALTCLGALVCISRVYFVASCADIRERDGGIADITTRERVEEVLAKILKLLSF